MKRRKRWREEEEEVEDASTSQSGICGAVNSFIRVDFLPEQVLEDRVHFSRGVITVIVSIKAWVTNAN